VSRYNRTDWLSRGTVVLASALVVRIWGIWYGLPSLYIGDESFHLFNALGMAARRSLEPIYVVYPSFYSYVLLAFYGVVFLVGRVSGVFASAVDFGLQYFIDPTLLFVVGRGLSAIAGAATVWLVYRMGVRHFGESKALLGGALLAFSFGHVYSSHWILLEAPVALMAALALAAILRYNESGRDRDFLVAGVVVGLAISTKYNAGFLILPLLLAAWWKARDAQRTPWPGWGRGATATLFGFVLGSPYWLLAPRRFLAQLFDTSARMSEGMVGHVARIPVLWPLVEMITSDWGVGVLLLLGFLLAFTGLRESRQRQLLLAYVIPSLLVIGFWRRTGIGYLMPFYPAFALLAGDTLTAFAGRFRRWATAGIAVAIAISVVQVVVYDVRLSGRDTRALAEDWILENLPPGSVVAYENFFYGPNLFDPERFVRTEEATLLPAEIVARLREEATRRPSYRLVHLRKDFSSVAMVNGLPPASYPTVQALRARGVEFLMLSSANYQRYFEAPPPRDSTLWRAYELGRSFYQSVFDSADFTLLAEFKPSFWNAGPVVRIYRIVPSQ
jgi:hypothetical protein